MIYVAKAVQYLQTLDWVLYESYWNIVSEKWSLKCHAIYAVKVIPYFHFNVFCCHREMLSEKLFMFFM